MFNTIDAAFYHPSGYAYFFKGPDYIKFLVPLGRAQPVEGGTGIVHSLAEHGWPQLPAEFLNGIDAGFYYPRTQATYLFKNDLYVKYDADWQPIPYRGTMLRHIGEPGWGTLPPNYKEGIDAVFYDQELQRVFFFKNDTFVEYAPGKGAVELPWISTEGTRSAAGPGHPSPPPYLRVIRQLGVHDGWSLPDAFNEGFDTAMHNTRDGHTYFFKGRRFVRRGDSEAMGPSGQLRIGLWHGGQMKDGWPGLSHILAGPVAGLATATSTRIWIWFATPDVPDGLRLHLNTEVVDHIAANPVRSPLDTSVQEIYPGSCIRAFTVEGLSPGVANNIDLYLDEQRLERIQVRAPPADDQVGEVRFAFTSCSNLGRASGAPTFKALREKQPHFTLHIGDNCYYKNTEVMLPWTAPPRPSLPDWIAAFLQCPSTPYDYRSTTLMMVRQLQARNDPHFSLMGLHGPLFGTWDDHDFREGGSFGEDPPSNDMESWLHGPLVSREDSGRVFRAMWPNNYRFDGTPPRDIRHHFRWGPVHVFMPDSRYNRRRRHWLTTIAADGAIWGEDQLEWLLDRMSESDAPVKVLVTSNQFLIAGSGDAHESNAVEERSAILGAINGVGDRTISGHVLLLSGDVHHSSLVGTTETPRALEFTSSPARNSHLDKAPPAPLAGRPRHWMQKQESFGLVHVRVLGQNHGTITLTACDDRGNPLSNRDMPGDACKSLWDLRTNEVRQLDILPTDTKLFDAGDE